MAPFADAVCFVHGHEGDGAALERLAEGRHGQALGGHEQKLEPALRHLGQHPPPRPSVQRGVQHRRADAGLLGPVKLILHERDEGAQDQRKARKQK